MENKAKIVKLSLVILVVILVAGVGFVMLGDGLGRIGFVCGESEVRDGEGNSYGTVQIGDQCWTSDNIRATFDVEGNEVTRYCYDDDSVNCDLYGGLYDWESASVVCPVGWRLPSDDDFKELELYLGMNEDELDETGWRNSGDVGDRLKSGGGSGFNAIMPGYMDLDGSFSLRTRYSFYWTSSRPGTLAWRRYLHSMESGILRGAKEVDHGYSVRCIKD